VASVEHADEITATTPSNTTNQTASPRASAGFGAAKPSVTESIRSLIRYNDARGRKPWTSTNTPFARTHFGPPSHTNLRARERLRRSVGIEVKGSMSILSSEDYPNEIKVFRGWVE
jgi:hypothetical protein